MKNLLLTALLLAAAFGCNNAEKAEKPVQEENSTGTSANEKLVRQYFEHFNNHEWKKMAAMYTETAEFKDPSLGTGILKQTRQETEKKYAEMAQMISDLKDEIVNVYPSGENHIIVEFVSTGTAPDKSTFQLPICTVFTIENGLISKDFTYYDNSLE
ncbi:nuclear transport factor 2 family protein [Dyadobacter crusticola]|uniref:nuclear transport factor 2 family protein n=1 Tax=Dyadobacter crusticola TaxID=292407 RepID=UPI0004E0C99D|nr:nuclear transport factor 2 family protein [Dyadobacter crusticola]